MPIEHQTTIKREHLQKRRNVLFVYGDTIQMDAPILRAKECRGEPNAIAIPVRHWGAFEEAAFLTNADLEAIKPTIQEGFRIMAAHVNDGGVVCFPSNGLGPDLGAGLRDHAPAVDAYITKCYRYLMSLDIKAQRAAGKGVDDPDAKRQS